MDVAALPGDRLRPATNAVARALALSLAIHLLFFGIVELSSYLHLHLPQWLRTVLNLSNQAAELKKAPAVQEPPILTFVEVDPSQATPEPPKETMNYSSFNSKASNPEVASESKPKLDGSQDKVPKVMDTLRPAPLPTLTPLKPEPPPLKTALEPKTEQKPGELALAKPADAKPKEEEEKPKRPRTLIEAQLQKGMMPGRKLRQEGGVRRHGTIASLDAMVTPYAAYDEAIIRAVSKRWYDILDATSTPTRP